jgi:hypothetical protein
MKKLISLTGFFAITCLVLTSKLVAQVGVGTSSPTAGTKFEIVGTSTTSTTTALRVRNSSSTTPLLMVRDDGNVGIGTTAPTAGLEILTDGSQLNALRVTSNQAYSSSPDAGIGFRFKFNTAGDYTSGAVISGIKENTTDGNQSGSLRFMTNSAGTIAERMRISSSGRVGIGTASPEASLHVSSSVSQLTTGYGWLNSAGNVGSQSGIQNVSYSIQADQRIRAPEFNAISDARIKKDITNQGTHDLLLELNKLNVVNYSYIDEVANGNKIKTGFIAQQIQDVNSRFVNQSSDFIPSVYSMAKSATIEKGMLQIFTDKPHGFKQGDFVKLFVEGKEEIIVTVEDIDNPAHFSVKPFTGPTNNLFIYGKKVSDFRAIDFDQITSLSVGAIQELSKQVDNLKAEIADLKKNVVQRIEFEELKNELMLLRNSINQKKN